MTLIIIISICTGYAASQAVKFFGRGDYATGLFAASASAYCLTATIFIVSKFQ